MVPRDVSCPSVSEPPIFDENSGWYPVGTTFTAEVKKSPGLGALEEGRQLCLGLKTSKFRKWEFPTFGLLKLVI